MILRRSLLLLSLVATAACDPGHLTDPDRFKKCQLNVEQDIFVAKCGLAGCHNANSPQNGLDLVTAGVGQRIKTGVSTVCMNKPLITYMAEKLGPMPACGSPMPLGNPLEAPELKCVNEYLANLKADGGT